MNKLLTERKPLIATAVVACLLVLVAGWFLLISPRRDKVAELQGQVSTQEAANNALRSQVANLQALAAQLPAQRAKLAAVSAKGPTQPALPELVRVLSEAATASGVKLTGITPSAPAAIAGANGVSGIDVALKVEGDYVSLEQYELALEGLSRAFLVQGVSISGSTGGTASGSTEAGVPKLTASINGRVLVAAAGA